MKSTTRFTLKLHGVMLALAFLLAFSSAAAVSAENGDALPDTVSFGGLYWMVLTVEEDRALILSERALEFRMFHPLRDDVTWEQSELRDYLNNEFLYSNFTSAERQLILPAWITNEDNRWFGTSGGNDTLDYLFLLSIEEVTEFFGDSGQLGDRYHQDNFWWGIRDQYSPERITRNPAGVMSWWWLRSPGNYNSGAVMVSPRGNVHVAGYNELRGGAWIRPALWLDLEALE